MMIMIMMIYKASPRLQVPITSFGNAMKLSGQIRSRLESKVAKSSRDDKYGILGYRLGNRASVCVLVRGKLTRSCIAGSDLSDVEINR